MMEQGAMVTPTIKFPQKSLKSHQILTYLHPGKT